MLQRMARPPNDGFTLVDALIAATVLAVGLLGNAAMLVHSLQSSRLALQRTQAVALAADMADRVRANRAATTAFALAPGVTLTAAATPCATVDQCSPAEVAASELYAWQQSVLLTLPNAEATIAVSPSAASAVNLYAITVRWTQSGDGAAASITLMVQT
jgi:type IV pilus assembly protein PilV